MNYRPIIK